MLILVVVFWDNHPSEDMVGRLLDTAVRTGRSKASRTKHLSHIRKIFVAIK